MLMPISARSWPDAHSSASRASTWPGDGRKSGRITPAEVVANHKTPRTAKTAAAMPRKSTALMRAPGLDRRPKALALHGRGIHEPGIEDARKSDSLLRGAGGA